MRRGLVLLLAVAGAGLLVAAMPDQDPLGVAVVGRTGPTITVAPMTAAAPPSTAKPPSAQTTRVAQTTRSSTVVTTPRGGVTIVNSGSESVNTGNNTVVGPGSATVTNGPATAVGNVSRP